MESLDRICFEVLRDTMHMQKDIPYSFVNKTLNVYVFFFYTNHLHFYIYSYKPNLIPRFVQFRLIPVYKEKGLGTKLLTQIGRNTDQLFQRMSWEKYRLASSQQSYM